MVEGFIATLYYVLNFSVHLNCSKNQFIMFFVLFCLKKRIHFVDEICEAQGSEKLWSLMKVAQGALAMKADYPSGSSGAQVQYRNLLPNLGLVKQVYSFGV